MKINSASFIQEQDRESVQFQLTDVIQLLKSNIRLITAASSAGLAAGFFYSVFSPRIYQGSFQILIKSDDQPSSVSSSLLNTIAPVIGTSIAPTDLVNHVKVLNSPSLLMPVFSGLNRTYPKDITDYGVWKKNVSIGLVKDSTVLTVLYSSANKATIIPVLDKLLSAIKDYSVRDHNQDIDAGIAYSQKQIDLYKVRANEASRAKDLFAIKYGLGKSGSGSVGSSNYIQGTDSLSPYRLGTTGSFNDSQSSNTGISTEAHHRLLDVTQAIIERELTFKKSDEKLKKLYLKQASLRKFIETTGGGNIALPESADQTKDKSQDLLLQYKKLERVSSQYDSVLASLEKTLLSLNMQKAQNASFWNEISTPSVDGKFISPNFFKNSFAGLLIGLIASSTYSLLLGRIKDRLYSSRDFAELSGLQMLFRISSDEMKLVSEKSEMLSNKFSTYSSAVIVPIDQRDYAIAQTIANSFSTYGLSSQVSSDISKSDASELTVLLVREGTISRNRIVSLSSDLSLKCNTVAGFIWLGDY